MPTAALRLCSGSPTCPNFAGQCPVHVRRKGWQGASPNRIRGRRLQSLRNDLFSREPLCRECLKHKRVTAATIRDHIIPLAEGGTDDNTNVQPLCKDCSDAKTHAESMRGRMRNR